MNAEFSENVIETPVLRRITGTDGLVAEVHPDAGHLLTEPLAP